MSAHGGLEYHKPVLWGSKMPLCTREFPKLPKFKDQVPSTVSSREHEPFKQINKIPNLKKLP